ncbi:MAG: type IV pilus twitching motility protein PilT [Planctomycetota bacterium]|nr:type IV pilus twitching motility protein PilT [Planctomycetota bacterium]
MPKVDRFLKAVKDYDGSDLHLLSGTVPKIRIHGRLRPLNLPSLEESQAREILYEILDEGKRERFERTNDLDFAYEIPDMARFRVNYFRHKDGIGGVFRMIPMRIRTLEELQIPTVVESFCHLRNGLVLVTGPTGSGKSTTLAALVDYINRSFSRLVITIEDPIEYVHSDNRSVIIQRELWRDTESFADALREAARQDPDVILVGEMRDLETIRLAISLAEMGFLVFATLHTNNAAKTIDRIINVFPQEQQAQIRTMLSFSLKGVLSQLLIPLADGKGRVPACEILFATSGLPNIIREGRVDKIVSEIQGGRGKGMQLMDDSIIELYKKKTISARDAYMKVLDKRRFEEILASEGEKVDW